MAELAGVEPATCGSIPVATFDDAVEALEALPAP